MTREEILRLQQEANDAQQRADQAKADADANPADATKALAAITAAAEAGAAFKAWKTAEQNLPTVSPKDWRVILLGIYLALTLLVSVYLLGVLTMAQPPEKTIGTLRMKCCGDKDQWCSSLPSSSPSPTASPSETNTATANSNSSNSDTASGDTNRTENSNAAANAANQNVNANTNSNRSANRNSAGANSNSANAANKTNSSNTNSNSFTQEIIEPTIPSEVCAAYFERIPADGFLFLIVLFAGMVGAVTRGIFSFVRHHGEKDFSFSWTWFYVFLPFSGPVISLFLYYIIRGGFYGSPVGKGLVLNIFAFVAIGTLSGLFAENAMEKLRQVAEVLLARVPAKVENPKPNTSQENKS